LAFEGWSRRMAGLTADNDCMVKGLGGLRAD
jgi:hypothetical protein